ncbi:FadR family transcriptional regulator [Priestia megaterium]|jgi:GntR family transcriptional regulator, transcriptional repressor for pyruvate dehydrogenase complex|uniref:FadR family transcriptional regulator n=1 Tax=Priestia megaterium TaxID=1404 RepID=A0A6H1NVT7_PRIMG|nr:FadR/GntR family transcriptional regulator [Priestia megaterium]QIZ05410.1 FadR family transcriptional regulator [Priestia megaterium]
MKNIKKVSMHEMIAEEIKRFINEHQLKRGDKLPSVAELTTNLGVSRSSIREGLRYLEGINVIEIQNGKGIFVKNGDALKIEARIDVEQEKNYLLHISELRRALEGKAVELATLRATDKEIKEMERLMAEVTSLKDAGIDSSEEDWAFHKAIYKASHNPLLESVAESVSDTFNKLWSKPFGIDHIFSDTLPFHLTMLEGIKQRDPARALQEFNKIIDTVENTVRQI